MTNMVHPCLNLQERDVEKSSAAFEFGFRMKKKENVCWCNRRRHLDRLSVKNARRHDASIVGRDVTCLEDSTNASFIEPQRAGGSYLACTDTS